MTWTRDLTDGLATHLAAAGIGLTYNPDGAYDESETGIVYKRMPPTPHRVVVLSPYLVGGDGTLSNVTLGVQARCRGVPGDLLDVDDLADDLYHVLHGAANLDLSGIRLSAVWRQSHTGMGVDGNHRAETSSNFYAITAHHSAHALD